MAGELFEREAERAALASAVERVATGDGGGLLMVLGEAGIGKTALLAVVADLARAAGIRAFRAAGPRLERDFGYGVVRQLLEGELRSRSPEERARLLSGACAPAAAVFSLPDLQAPLLVDPDRSLAVRHALVLLVGELARERPVALVVDDLHWADGASLRWLAHLARRGHEPAPRTPARTRADRHTAAQPRLAHVVGRPVVSHQARHGNSAANCAPRRARARQRLNRARGAGRCAAIPAHPAGLYQ